MAITRTAPFEERTVGADTIVTGLQDAAILFSVLDHMKTAPEGDRCAIISNDKMFHAAETRNLVHIWDATRAGWQAEMAQIEASLNADKEELSRQIQAILPASEVGHQIWGRVKEVTGFSVTEFRYVLTEMPESQHRPPQAETYKRPDGDEVKISAKALTKIDAIVETTNWLGAFAIGIQQPPITTKTETTTLTETLNVSITGTVRDGIVGDFKVTSVDPNGAEPWRTIRADQLEENVIRRAQYARPGWIPPDGVTGYRSTWPYCPHLGTWPLAAGSCVHSHRLLRGKTLGFPESRDREKPVTRQFTFFGNG
jgi:hypothetical protein